MADNLKAQLQINQALRDRQSLMDAQTESLKDQIALSQGLQQSLSGKGLDDVKKKIADVASALTDADAQHQAAGKSARETLRDAANLLTDLTSPGV